VQSAGVSKVIVKQMVFPLITLTTEAFRVIELRLRMMALGNATADEMILMVTEKFEALQHAGRALARGGSPSVVVDNYNRIVAANVVRLSQRRD
jgi:hypothetical protein